MSSPKESYYEERKDDDTYFDFQNPQIEPDKTPLVEHDDDNSTLLRMGYKQAKCFLFQILRFSNPYWKI